MCPRLHVIRNNVEKVTVDVGGSTESVFTSWKCEYKVKHRLQQKRVTTQQVYKVKRRFWTWRKWDGSYIKCDLFNVINYYVKSEMRIAEQASICEYIYIYIYISGGPLSALTCCVNVRLLSAIKKISPLIYSQSWVGSWVYTTQAMMTFTLIF